MQANSHLISATARKLLRKRRAHVVELVIQPVSNCDEARDEPNAHDGGDERVLDRGRTGLVPCEAGNDGAHGIPLLNQLSSPTCRDLEPGITHAADFASAHLSRSKAADRGSRVRRPLSKVSHYMVQGISGHFQFLHQFLK